MSDTLSNHLDQVLDNVLMVRAMSWLFVALVLWISGTLWHTLPPFLSGWIK